MDRPFDIFNEQLAALLEADMPLPESIRMAAQELGSPILSEAVDRVSRRVADGETLAQAMEQEPTEFPGWYVELVRAGEEAGNLGEVLELAVEQAALDRELSSRVFAAAAYPAIVVVVAACVFVLLSTTFAGAMDEFLGNFQHGIPQPFGALYRFGSLFGQHTLLVCVVFLALGALAVTPLVGIGRTRSLTRIAARIPLVGSVLQLIHLNHATALTAQLLERRVQPHRALSLVASGTQHPRLAKALEELSTRLRDGVELASAVENLEGLPSTLGIALASAAAGGDLTAALSRLAEFYQLQIDVLLPHSIEVLRFALHAIVAVVVGLVAMSMFLSLWSAGGMLT